MKKNPHQYKYTLLTVALTFSLIYFSVQIFLAAPFQPYFWLNCGFVSVNIIALIERKLFFIPFREYLQTEKKSLLINALTSLSALFFCIALFTSNT
jgi:hypothetical protein